ncbi:TspO/MBR family protein [Gracilimonas sediminicola]|uniref:Tryptophan-rich sensory protein n=1 Tax=Gracilimonas sediminicola TaxID=2952158 RepID=A0A9X2L0A6_9BACT|nr:TspO/MBR family protein [Gracilimonas sediminicola]MCP9289971.1 tryptophan-rich sensory protein [Gracilimonas sediminicola]
MKNIPFWAKVIFGILACNAVGLAASSVTLPAITTWYADLNKPSFNPPNWLFGPVWTTLYTLMGVAAAGVWEEGFPKPPVKSALTVFGVQLFLNGLWSFLFFGLQSPLIAFIEIILLLVFIVLTFKKFREIKWWIGWLLVPYLLWVAFAAILNLFIVVLN